MTTRYCTAVGAALFAAACAAEPTLGQDWTYNPGTGHWYALTSLHGTWLEANAQALAAGGYLVTICSGPENDWVTSFAAEACVRWVGRCTPGEPTMGNAAWIGYRDAGAGFGWENGEVCGYTNLAGCPAPWDAYSGAYAYIHGANHPCPGKWNHNPYHEVHPDANLLGVIERDAEPPSAIPAVSQWGLAVLTLLMLAAARVISRHQRVAAT